MPTPRGIKISPRLSFGLRVAGVVKSPSLLITSPVGRKRSWRPWDGVIKAMNLDLHEPAPHGAAWRRACSRSPSSRVVKLGGIHQLTRAWQCLVCFHSACHVLPTSHVRCEQAAVMLNSGTWWVTASQTFRQSTNAQNGCQAPQRPQLHTCPNSTHADRWLSGSS